MDPRTEHTRSALQAALFELLKTTAIQQITVAELCKVAGISRRTFYVHYQKVTDILDDYRQSLYWQVRNAISQNHQTAESLLGVFDKILHKNLTGFRYLCTNNYHRELVAKFQNLLFTVLADSLQSPLTNQQLLVLQFLSTGLIQTYVYWFTHPHQVNYEDVVKTNRQLIKTNWRLLNK